MCKDRDGHAALGEVFRLSAGERRAGISKGKIRVGRVRLEGGIMAAVEDVIFLGAGASASEGAPVQKDLFCEFFRADRKHSSHPDSIGRLARFFRDFFGLDVRDASSDTMFPSFEETLGILEIAMDRGESFRGYSIATGAPDVQTVREDLIFLIALVLNRTLQNPRGYHRELVNRLEREGRMLCTAFISLNYDILIDTALTELHPDIDIDYGVEFTNYHRECDWRIPRKERSVFLLKIHGSLNWLYCPTCISLTLTPREREVTRLVEHAIPCAQCGMPMVPIITPPTFLKGMKNYFLNQIMHASSEILRNARRIIFCGYSFPDADLLVRYLLKRLELNYDSRPDILVLNSYEGKGQASKVLEEQRYKRFFRHKDQVRYLDMTFSDFCLSGVG